MTTKVHITQDMLNHSDDDRKNLSKPSPYILKNIALKQQKLQIEQNIHVNLVS